MAFKHMGVIFRELIISFLESANEVQFWEAMTISSLKRSKNKPLVSPLRLLITTYPDLAKMALDRCMGTNSAKYRTNKKGVSILGNLCAFHDVNKVWT